MFHSNQQSPKKKVAKNFWSTLKVVLYAKEIRQARNQWQHQQVNRSNSIIRGGGYSSKGNLMWLNIEIKGLESLSSCLANH